MLGTPTDIGSSFIFQFFPFEHSVPAAHRPEGAGIVFPLILHGAGPPSPMLSACSQPNCFSCCVATGDEKVLKGSGKEPKKLAPVPKSPVITVRGCRLPDSRAPRIASDAQAQVRLNLCSVSWVSGSRVQASGAGVSSDQVCCLECRLPCSRPPESPRMHRLRSKIFGCAQWHGITVQAGAGISFRPRAAATCLSDALQLSFFWCLIPQSLHHSLERQEVNLCFSWLH